MVNPLKNDALLRDHGQCRRINEDGRMCGCSERLTMHHLVPKRMGGRDELSNVVIWCHECHRKYNKLEHAQKKRLSDLRKTCKWTVNWNCKPTSERCDGCNRYTCANWPEGFIEGLLRMLAGVWTTEPVKR